jgi:hypothetical protein
MRKIFSAFFIVVGISVSIFIGAVYFSLQWIDKQAVPSSVNARQTLHFVAIVYPYLPGKCTERCVIRTIKISNLVALSEYGKKSPENLANDLAIGFSLLNGMLIQGGLPDKTAEYEISLERLMFFNRMNALAMNLGRNLYGDEYLRNVTDLQRFAYDEESRSVFRREALIYQALNKSQNQYLNHVPIEYSPELTFPAAYEEMVYGWIMCATKVDAGKDYLSRMVPFFRDKRMNLIHAITRNLDAPLIALAEKNPACQDNVAELKTLLGD